MWPRCSRSFVYDNARSYKCDFGRQEQEAFSGTACPERGVSVDPRKVQSIVEWATPTSCTEVRRNNYYRRLVEGYSKVAAPGSPTVLFAWSQRRRASTH